MTGHDQLKSLITVISNITITERISQKYTLKITIVVIIVNQIWTIVQNNFQLP